MWFGLLGAPAAFTVFHVSGYALSEAECNVAGRSTTVGFDTWALVITAAAAAIAVAAALSSFAAWRLTRDAGDELPAARVHFLSIMGMTVAPLMLAIILMGGLGAIFLSNCVQS